MQLPRNPDCIFCKIVAGQVPSQTLYDDADVVAFLDVGPLSKGHALVVPKGHWVTLDEVPQPVSAAIGGLLPALSRAVVQSVGATAWNVLQNNGLAAHQVVDHVHFHIIPKFKDAGLEIHWPAGRLDTNAAVALRQKITAAMGQTVQRS